MIFKNVEIHNVAKLYEAERGGTTWLRVPEDVYSALEHGVQARNMAKSGTGVELRFVIKSGEGATIRMAQLDPCNFRNVFHVYRGGIQGGWEDCELNCVVPGEPTDFFIKKTDYLPYLKKAAAEYGDPWDPEVIRVIIDRGAYRILDVIGDVAPPERSMCPEKTVMFYGSSITSGSNSIDASHSWPAVVGYNLACDVKNLGLSGSCAIEPAVIDYIADTGKNGGWDVCVMELGINVLGWDRQKKLERATNAVRTVALSNPDKKVFVISPFYTENDFIGEHKAAQWREVLESVVKKENLANVTYINGLSLLGSVKYLSADKVHPNIYGVQKIADSLTAIMKKEIKEWEER